MRKQNKMIKNKLRNLLSRKELEIRKDHKKQIKNIKRWWKKNKNKKLFNKKKIYSMKIDI